MTQTKLMVAVGLVAAIVVAPSYAAAQSRGRQTGRAVPRTAPAPRQGRPPAVAVVPYRPYYYGPYRSGVNLGFYYGYGYPGYLSGYRYGYGYGYRGYGYPAYGYSGYGYSGYGYPGYGYSGYGYPGYGYPGYAVTGRPYGGVRIDLPQRDAEVYADGYFAGNVDNFDGALQQLNLEAGPHRIEVRAEGFEPIAFDVNVEPGRTITYRAAMRPRP